MADMVYLFDDVDSDSSSSTVIVSEDLDLNEGPEHDTSTDMEDENGSSDERNVNNLSVPVTNSEQQVAEAGPSTLGSHVSSEQHATQPEASNLNTQSLKDFGAAADCPQKMNLSSSSDEEGQTCPICFEAWDNSGPHRLVSLQCGHLFGQHCIVKWLKLNAYKCPQCKAKCRLHQIRVLYATCLKVKDTAERDRAKQELEQERATRLTLQINLMVTEAKYEKAQQELEILKAKLKREAQNSPAKGNPSNLSTQPSSKLLSKERSLEICKEGNCRVFAYMDFMKVLVVSQPSVVPIYPGFGLKKVNVLDFRPSDYIPIHQKQIRDVCFSRDRLDGLVLTASMDKTVKLTSLLSNSCVQTYTCDAAAWSCTWNARNSNEFFAGLSNGAILLYDIRQTTGHVCKLPPTGSLTPVVSLQHAPMSPLSSLNCEGLIAGQLERCSFFEWMPDEYALHLFPVEGPVTTVSLEQNYQHLLVSYRPSSHHKYTRHVVYELAQNSGNVRWNRIETFFGGATQHTLVKNRLMQNPLNEGSLIGCVADESSKSSIIFDVKTGQALQKLPSDQPVLDMCSIKGQDHELFATLTERLVNVYCWH